MKIEEINHICTGCSACQTICPKKCIKMCLNDEGFYYPYINHEMCTFCGLCEKTCQVLNKSVFKNNWNKKAYYGWHKDEKKRYNSSSGGAFVAIADYILKQNGLVFGAIFDKDTKSIIHTNSDITPLSKI